MNIRKTKILLAIASVLLLGATAVYAANITFNADYTVALSGSSVSLTIASGSKLDNLIIGTNDIQVVVGNGDTLTVSSSNGTRISVSGNTSATLNYTCNTVVITGGSGGETITLSPAGSSCAGSSGGGGGGSGGSGHSYGNATSTSTSTPSTTTPTDCRPGDLFSISTGKSCAGATVTLPPGCLPGYRFSTLTGQACPSENNTVINNFNGPTGAMVQFTQNLTVGSKGAEVVALQTYLVAKGFLIMPPGVAMGYFGKLTKAALAHYQASVGITPAVGYFGPITRAYVNSHQ